MLSGKPYIPDVYSGGNDALARGECRNPTLVLDEKFKYLGGKDIKPTEHAKNQRVDQGNHFVQTYNAFPDSKNTGATIFSDLNTLLPDVSTRNPHILATASYILNRLRDRGKKIVTIDDLQKADFDQVYASIAMKLNSAMPKKSGAKAEIQSRDVLRYIAAILNFESED